ncbi:DUF4249 domain-containing protein [Chitinophaga sedimenti]|uniref:DUF4249 family protein n=1 Tax=Chitinophaga sedimenti TaxID=2033606 RepID=UPI0020038D8D|nr:DUF4249 family protein [Chitinophaga sedimenti]MCK7557680.1 DUF4249 domain-containing protein [Chitinophaga sedimenti]
MDIFIGLMIALLPSCMQKADIAVPYDGDKMVVNTLMQADSPAYIRVTRSARAGASKFEELSGASVELLENGVPMNVSRQVINGAGYFVSAQPLKYGSQYVVKAAYQELVPVVGEDSLPQKPVVASVKAFGSGSRIQFVVKDRTALAEYYRIRIFHVRADTFLGARFDPSYNNEFINVIGTGYVKTNIIGDERFNGRGGNDDHANRESIARRRSIPAGGEQSYRLPTTTLKPLKYRSITTPTFSSIHQKYTAM